MRLQHSSPTGLAESPERVIGLELIKTRAWQRARRIPSSRGEKRSSKAETITDPGDAPGQACHRVGESQEQTGEPHAHCRRAARGAGPGRLVVDAARTQVFAGFSWESGARATTLFSGAERYFARSGLSAWGTALLLFEVSFHHARCAGGQGREGRQTVKSRDVRKALLQTVMQTILYCFRLDSRTNTALPSAY